MINREKSQGFVAENSESRAIALTFCACAAHLYQLFIKQGFRYDRAD